MQEEKEEKLTRNTSGAVDENEDHATSSPCNSKNSHPGAGIGDGGSRMSLRLVANDGQNKNVKEEKGRYEFCDESSVERPFGQLFRIKQG